LIRARLGLLDLAIPDGLVNGHETLITGLRLPDANDRHVLAAAIRCNASVIVTFNEKDFPASARFRRESRRAMEQSGV
jgi:hypothetical protein